MELPAGGAFLIGRGLGADAAIGQGVAALGVGGQGAIFQPP